MSSSLEDELFPSTPGKFKIERASLTPVAATSPPPGVASSGRSRFATLPRSTTHGDGVVGIDNFNSYYDPSLKEARRSLLKTHDIFIVKGNINDNPRQAIRHGGVHPRDALGGSSRRPVRHGKPSFLRPQQYRRPRHICKSANPQPSIVWASSSSVYGLNDNVPFSELHRTDQPASLYAATKKADEEITHTYNHIYGLSITGLRFFTVYGPWGRPDMAYFSFTRNILRGKPITIYRGKDGIDLARDFTYIDDIVKGCLGSLDTSRKSTGSGGKKQGLAPYQIFNLGNTSPMTVPTLVNILERHLKTKAKKKVVDMPGNGDVPFTHANISLAGRELGYKPTTNLQSGLNRILFPQPQKEKPWEKYPRARKWKEKKDTFVLLGRARLLLGLFD